MENRPGNRKRQRLARGELQHFRQLPLARVRLALGPTTTAAAESSWIGSSTRRSASANANRNWDACGWLIPTTTSSKNNDFSHASNTCLWTFWTACRNEVRKNNLSYGLRIDPGEIHARDSACMLIEGGSDDNRFLDNDITYGGDGVFIRGTERLGQPRQRLRAQRRLLRPQ